jgi:hypothetical protein
MTGPDSQPYTGGVSEKNIKDFQVDDGVEVFVTLPEVLPLPSIVHTMKRLVNEKTSAHQSLKNTCLLYVKLQLIFNELCSFELKDLDIVGEEIGGQARAPPPKEMDLYVTFSESDFVAICILSRAK